MALTSDLMGLGAAAAMAAALGETVATVVGATTAQATAPTLVASINLLTTAASQTACVLPASWPVGKQLIVQTTTSTAGLVFPPLGGAIDNGSANASVSCAQSKLRMFWRVSPTAWISSLSA